MSRLKTLSVLSCITAAINVSAGENPADTILSRVAGYMDPAMALTSTHYDNPALKPFYLPWSYSSAGLAWDYDMASEPVKMQEGRGHNRWEFNADSYVRYRNSTIWGRAYYRNGRTRDMLWNETSQPELVYPYLTGDAVGGDMDNEDYHFSGGYAGVHGRLTWGATLGYTATLNYRRVDPRPRNVTGQLAASAGIAMELWPGWMTGVSARVEKYKQTCSIKFVSELGSSKIYHLTGLGTDYTRFNGNGTSYYYNGVTWGGSLNVCPTGTYGPAASVSVDRFSFDKILSDLNRLPLVHLGETSVHALLSWREPVWTATVDAIMINRRGTENIFGDAASSVYPQIGSLPQYSRDQYILTAHGAWTPYLHGLNSISIEPGAGYISDRQSYTSPAGHISHTSALTSIKACGGYAAGKRVYLHASASYAARIAMDSSIALPSATTVTASPELNDYRYASGSEHTVAIDLSATVSITPRYALQLTARGSDTRYRAGVNRRAARVSIAVIF